MESKQGGDKNDFTVHGCDVFGVFYAAFRELGWKTPIFYERVVQKTPGASYSQVLACAARIPEAIEAQLGLGRIVIYPTVPPLYTRFTKRIGASSFEATMRPNPRPSRARCCSPTRWPTLRTQRRAIWSRKPTSPRACSSSPGSTPGRAGLPRPPRCWRAPSRAATTATRGSGRRGCSTPRCPASPGARRRRRGHCHAPCISSTREYPYRTNMRPVYLPFVSIRTEQTCALYIFHS